MAAVAVATLSVDLLTGGTAWASAHRVSRLSVWAGNGTAGAPTPGLARQSRLDEPFGLAVDAKGDLFIADALNHEVEKVTPAGKLTIFAGTGHNGATKPGQARRGRPLLPRWRRRGPVGDRVHR